MLFHVFQYLLELLDPADPSLAEVDLDMAGELVVNKRAKQLGELVEFVHISVFHFHHCLSRPFDVKKITTRMLHLLNSY